MTALPPDYETDPDRFRLARRTTARYSLVGDVHAPVGERLRAEGLTPVLDLGGGDGALAEHLSPRTWIGLDRARALLAAAPRPTVEGDATCLPVRDSSVGAVCALWMLYHLDAPEAAIAEAYRVLRSGGLFAACTTARDDSPELLAWLQPPEPSTFDAEEAAEIVAGVFGSVEVERWDAPLVQLPTAAAVHDYLVSRQITPETAAEVATEVALPLSVTKRGCLVWARKP